MSLPVPTVKDLSSIYSINVDGQAKRYARLTESFEKTYGSKPDFIARAPGRVNIIGEHIDYCGFPVFPMAIAPDTLIAARASGTSRVRVANINSEKYPARDFSATGDVFDIDSRVHEWSNYFKCGYRGVFDYLGRKDGKGFDVLLDGTVPAGSGLSSSAAFVCATELAVQRINNVDLTQSELASIAAGAECHVGVNSGGMDQTASIMGQQGSALFIEFHPRLRATPVKFPETSPPLAFIIANTLVVSDKHVTAPVCYNLRVVETRILNRALHVFSETLRVVQFRQICEHPSGDNVAVRLGALMNQSQDSCRDTFECSCAELDELCTIARGAGAFGSRLTGAGWGGCSVHMVAADKVEQVKSALAEQYYAKRYPQLTREQLDDALFATAPGCGACYYV
ncbi:galactokinase [Coemansia interrupta]|uniref:Galactokinase n=1 Tax=Coemansia interrupta TaxID=1126814 RepID=A0A9W8HNE0_9FUNG|nr:galactokinase [Coemansia interrupta]